MKIPKYRARKSRARDGRMFDSATERNRYEQLLLMQRAGEIEGLRLQQRFCIIPALKDRQVVQLKTRRKIVERVIERAAYYTADFVYKTKDGRYCIEEVKSAGTMLARDYSLRRKLIRWRLQMHNERHGRRNVWVWNEIKQAK